MEFNYCVFSTQNHHYLFDGVSSNIFQIPPSIYENHKKLIRLVNEGNTGITHEFEAELSQIREAIENKVLVPRPNNAVSYWFDEDDFTTDFRSQIRHLMIGVTEKCNMRCKYCVYSGHYENERTHTENEMDFDMMKRSISTFFNISKSSQKIINFYGGEPFLSFEAIKKAVECINSLNNTTMIYITTNGLLLSEKITEWFSENNNVHIYVSIAGTPDVHDSLRVMKDNRPTYEVIKENLLKIKAYDKESYNKRIHFIFNLLSELQLLDTQQFWDTENIFEGSEHEPEISFIDLASGDDYVHSIGSEIIDQYNKKYDVDLLGKYIELLSAKKFDALIVRHFDEKFMNIHRRSPEHDHVLGGVCQPFIKKMFIDVQGRINICENFTFGNAFGSIDDKFHYQNTRKLLDIYKFERKQTCASCWASKMCSLCFRDLIDRDGTVNHARASKLCRNERRSLRNALSEYCRVLENDDTLLDHLHDYQLHL